MSEYFPKLKYVVANGKVELDLSNNATKTNLKIQQVFLHQTLLNMLKSYVENFIFCAL